MNLKYFGCAALVGLGCWWFANRQSLRVHASEARTLTASFYADECRGKVTASGDIFDPNKLTGASWQYYRRKLRVTGPKGSVEVFINDRGPGRKYLISRQLDLSRAAFEQIADLKQGLCRVTVEVL